MHTRRAFLKLLFGLGAFLLPWTVWPEKFNHIVKSKSAQPQVKLYKPILPPVPKDLKESLKKKALDDIIALTNPEMEGRRAGTIGESRASEYLIKELHTLGLTPLGSSQDSFAHSFTIPSITERFIRGRLTFSAGPMGKLRTPSLNIIGKIEGEAPDKVVILSAHYDHMGLYQGKLYPGANDNASGVGCVLEVTRRLIKEKVTPKSSLVIAFWSGEEMGFVGSKAFVKEPTFPIHYIQAVINVDTIGNGNVGDYALWSNSKNSIAVKAVQNAAQELGAKAPLTPGNGHNSDQVTFTDIGIPAVTIMAREWLKNNHSPQDTVENINPDQLEMATELLYRTIKILAF